MFSAHSRLGAARACDTFAATALRLHFTQAMALFCGALLAPMAMADDAAHELARRVEPPLQEQRADQRLHDVTQHIVALPCAVAARLRSQKDAQDTCHGILGKGELVDRRACHLHRAGGRTVERDAVGIVDEPIEDGVSKRRFANDLMPGVNRQLAGDDG